MFLLVVATISLAAWVYLVGCHGGFWITSRYNDLAAPDMRSAWPDIIAVVPARDEAQTIGDCIGSVLSQPYAGKLSVVLVDDQSSDGTAELAAATAMALGASDRLTIISGQTPPAGWTGKLWALKQGINQLEQSGAMPTYVLLTDADIVYSGDVVSRLVARAETEQLAMTSIMARLRCKSFAERFLIPAFIFFFQMLYPFAWVARGDRATAAAAGGCVLARWSALRAAGGIDAIRGSLIDDCAMGRLLKSQGPVWLGFSKDVSSIRASATFSEVGHMISRSAYAQLRFSPVLLVGTIVAMTVIYLAPAWLMVVGASVTRLMALAAWALMAISFQPTLRYYECSPLWGVFLPAIALTYLIYTINSAYQYYMGRGGMWKGRAQANLSGFK
jgi:hopene-associated glycosyltransferase HpnB